MKHIYLFLISLFSTFVAFSQNYGNYYNTITQTDSALVLKNKLKQIITSTHNNISYARVWDVLKESDLDLTNRSNVVLVYGYNDSDETLTNDRTRGKTLNGGGTSQWNREHVYPKSQGRPDLGETGPGSDAHHLRPADPTFNGQRGNRAFGESTNSTGFAGVNTDGSFFPGEEWKGDVARMIMYMYMRYDERCNPKRVGIDTLITYSQIDDMIDLFIKWHEEDPVSALEIQRNDVVARFQGNRNPFIDKPEYVSKVWKTSPAAGNDDNDNEQPNVSTTVVNQQSIALFPNPTSGIINIQSGKAENYKYNVTDALGRVIVSGTNSNSQIDLTNYNSGAYFITVTTPNNTKTLRVIKR